VDYGDFLVPNMHTQTNTSTAYIYAPPNLGKAYINLTTHKPNAIVPEAGTTPLATKARAMEQLPELRPAPQPTPQPLSRPTSQMDNTPPVPVGDGEPIDVEIPKWTKGLPSTPDEITEYKQFMIAKYDAEQRYNAELLRRRKVKEGGL